MKDRDEVVVGRILVRITAEVDGKRQFMGVYTIGVNASGRFAVCTGGCEKLRR